MTQHDARPWYCNERLTDDWVVVAQEGGDLKMLKALKILRSVIVNVGIIAIVLYGLWLGGSPDVIVPLSLVVLGAYNGVEFADYLALAQAFAEVKHDENDGGGGE
jgi:hypothetical protein